MSILLLIAAIVFAGFSKSFFFNDSIFSSGHTFSHSPQSVHFSLFTSGYQKPSMSVLRVIIFMEGM